MKRSVVAVLMVAGLSACFDDPTSSLRSGPAAVVLDRSAVLLINGDSVRIEARITDAQGNPLPISSPSWTSDDPTIASVTPAETQAGAVVTAAYIKALNGLGAVTFVRFSSRGVSDSVRVTSLPLSVFPTGTSAVTGTAAADTLAGGTVINAGDTLVVTAPNLQRFDVTAGAGSVVHLGAQVPYQVSRTATTIKVVSRGPYRGPVTVTNVIISGNPAQGTADLTLDSLTTPDTVTVARGRFRGTVTQRNGAFGVNTELKVTPAAGTKFRDATSPSNVFLAGTAAAIILVRTPDSIVVISSANYTGTVRISNIDVGTVRFDSLRTAGATTINASNFPGTVTNGTGNLLETIVVRGNGLATFATGTAPSVVTVNGLPALLVQRTADSIKVVAAAPGTAAVSITNVIVGTSTIPALATSAALVVNATTGEADEPGNDLPSTSPTLAATGTFQTLHGAVTPGTDVDDFFKIVLATPLRIDAVGRFRGTGAGAGNPDIDFFVVRDLDADDNVFDAADFCDEFGGTFAEADCKGATGAQPEFEITQVLPVGTYFIYVNLFAANGVTVPMSYQMQYRVIP